MVPSPSFSDSQVRCFGENAIPSPIFEPTSTAQVGAGFLAYLEKRRGAGPLHYLESPVPISDGWETYTYHLQLKDAKALPDMYLQPLILRIYSSPHGISRARHEFAVQRYLGEVGYPVPKPVLLEESCEFFGGPFLLMEQLPGQTLFRALLQNPARLWRSPAQMAALHARLHALPCTGFPSPPGPLLSRYLEEMRVLIHNYGLHGLTTGLHWLSAQRPAENESPSILHMDFHPLNLVHGQGSSLVAVDWTEADVGDLHADLATTLMLMDCCPVGAANLWERLAVPVGRRLLSAQYLRAYRKKVALDERKLSYYSALGAFRRLCRYGRWLCAGPEITGCKPSSIQHLSRDHLRTLQNYFRKWTGVRIALMVASDAD